MDGNALSACICMRIHKLFHNFAGSRKRGNLGYLRFSNPHVAAQLDSVLRQ